MRLLLASTGPRPTSWAHSLFVRLWRDPQIDSVVIVDEVAQKLLSNTRVLPNRKMNPDQDESNDNTCRKQARELVEWAEMMVCVPLDADVIAKMLVGAADTLLEEVLRSWDTRKTMVLVPGMSTPAEADANTLSHLSYLRRNCPWIQVQAPIMWRYETSGLRLPLPWKGFHETLVMIKKQADLLDLERHTAMAAGSRPPPPDKGRTKPRLPPEIWSMVLDSTGDWELAQALGIYCSLPVPKSFVLAPKDSSDPLKVYRHELERTLLTGDSTAICEKLSQSPPGFERLSPLAAKLVLRFARIDVLQYIEVNRPDLFKAFGEKVLPTYASVHYPRIEVLEFWRTCRLLQEKPVYDAAAIDGASGNGHVRVLDWWWRQSGLPLRYTKSALERASGRGQLRVLEWWRKAAAQDPRIVLRRGQSLLWAAHFSQLDVLRWWSDTGTSAVQGDKLTKAASGWGRVDILEAWRRIRGDDCLSLKAGALVVATAYQQIEVLEWWRGFAQGKLEGMDGQQRDHKIGASNIKRALGRKRCSAKVASWWTRHGQDLGIEWSS